MMGRAYEGEPAGAMSFEATDGMLRVVELLRPDVPMGQLVALAPVVALGALDALEALGMPRGEVGLAWPHSIVRVAGHEPLVGVEVRAGYAGGTFAVASLELLASGGESTAAALCEGVGSRVTRWSGEARGERAKVGPWAPFLPEYFDRVVLMGQPVDVRYPNGRLYAQGRFVGVDVWGRATVRTARLGDIEFPPERFAISPRA